MNHVGVYQQAVAEEKRVAQNLVFKGLLKGLG